MLQPHSQWGLGTRLQHTPLSCHVIYMIALLRTCAQVYLAPSVSALRQMLRCCECFASIYGLKFNPAKTQLIKFSAYVAGSSTPPSIKFCGSLLAFSNTVMHLGNILSSDLNDSEDILSICRDMLTKFNALFSCFPNLDPSILTNLFQSYCLSLHGSALWNISSRSLQTLEVSTKSCVES